MRCLSISSLAALLAVFFSIPVAQAQNAASPSRTPGRPIHHSIQQPQLQSVAPAGAHHVVMLRVDEIIAADTNEGMDKRLMPLGIRLESLFPFTTYRLVSRQVRRTECGRMIAFTLPGGWILHVRPNSVDKQNMIAMQLLLFQGSRPMMTTDLKLRNHGMLIWGGPHYQQGMLIIPIGADAVQIPPPAAVLSDAPHPTVSPTP